MKNLIILSTLFVATACQNLKTRDSGPINNISSVQQGQWEAKAMVKNLDSGKAHIVNLDILGKRNEMMRIEVTTAMGIALASIVIHKNQIQYLLPREKNFFDGSFNEDALKPVLRVPLDPRLLSAAFFEEIQSDWKCETKENRLSRCHWGEEGTLVWEMDSQQNRRVIVSSPHFEIQIQIKKFTEKAELPASAGVLRIPENYKKTKLN